MGKCLSIWNGCVYSDIRISQSGHLFLISSLHLCRSCNTDFAVVRSSPSLLMSLDILRAQVNFGAPRAIFSGLSYSVMDCLIGVDSGRRITCPYSRSLLSVMVWLHRFCLVSSYSASELIFRGHLMFIAFLSIRLWKLSIEFDVVLFTVQVSLL